MRAFYRAFPLLLTAIATGCDQPAPTPGDTPPATNAASQKAPGKTTAPPKRELPKLPPLTADVARRVLASQLDQLGGDDVSRQALLYMADLGDRSAVNAIHEKLLTLHEGAFEDVLAAAVGVEALLAYGEPGASAKALEVAKQYKAEEEDPDEYLVHMLARVTGPERGAAVAELVAIAQGDDEDVASVAIDELAKLAAPEANAAFLAVAANPELEGHIRGAAAAGLLRLSDPKAKELTLKLFAGPGEADTFEGPEPEDVIEGLGVEGAVEASPYIRNAVDSSLTEEGLGGVWEVPAAASALARIHRKGGGAELVPWLRAIAQRDDAFHEDDAALALFAFGDDGSAALVAQGLEGSVAAGWAQPSQMETAVEILDIAARRGVAARPPFDTIVSCAAQLDPKRGSDKGIDYNLRSLSLAAAHAYLKSIAK